MRPFAKAKSVSCAAPQISSTPWHFVPRPRLALGLGLALGKLRWVTTYILRFDPDHEWPNDLNCTVQVNPMLRAYDGTPLDAPMQATLFPFTTEALSMSIVAVESRQASEHTGVCALFLSRTIMILAPSHCAHEGRVKGPPGLPHCTKAVGRGLAVLWTSPQHTTSTQGGRWVGSCLEPPPPPKQQQMQRCTLFSL